MKAVICSKYGGPDVLELKQIDKPLPNENEILINIHATTVSSGDVRVRSLEAPVFIKPLMRLVLGFRKPRQPILGTELAGKIEAIGQKVTRFQVGEPVMAFTGMKFGAHAEYICVPENGLVTKMPEQATYEEAAAILFGGTSALHFLSKAKLKAGHKVLIYGASGSVGSSSVQLAKYFGAKVTGVCSTANSDMVRSLGADQIIDYTKENVGSLEEEYDIIFDAVGKITKSQIVKSLAPGGRFVSVARGFARELQEDVVLLKQLLEQGHIIPVIDRIYPLAEIVKAHRHVEGGHKKGNIIVKIK